MKEGRRKEGVRKGRRKKAAVFKEEGGVEEMEEGMRGKERQEE
jgi:hypothetical protein